MGFIQMRKKIIIPYKHDLVEKARKLRNNATFTERMLWKYLKRKQMRGYDFDRQKPIENYIVDFFCSELLLAIEVDCESHNEKEKYDKHRQKCLENLGITVLRFDGYTVLNNSYGVLQVIYNWIKVYEKTHP